VMLALEVTVGVTAEQRSAGETPKRSEQPVTRNGELLLTGEDREFLHGLRIGD